METKKKQKQNLIEWKKKSHFSCNICISMKPNKLLLEMQIMDEQKKNGLEQAHEQKQKKIALQI